MRKIIYIIIAITLFLNCIDGSDLNFTFNNKTSYEIDSVVVTIIASCSQCPQVEKSGEILPGKTVKLTVIPYDGIVGGEGSVVLKAYYGSLQTNMAAPINGGRFYYGPTGSSFRDHKLVFSIMENDTGLVLINDYERQNTIKVKHISTEFNYAPNIVPDFQSKPLSQRKGDTLIITDYWVVSTNTLLQAKANIHYKMITLTYSETQTDNFIEYSDIQTIEAISKFVGIYPKYFYMIFDSFHNAVEPSELEKEQGFRDARKRISFKIIPN